MAIVVSLRDFVGEMQILSEEAHTYINKLTGELITITDDDIAMSESDEQEDSFEWQEEIIETTKKILSSNDYLGIPSKFDIDEYEIMERFCLSIPEESISDDLLGQIRGSGLFTGLKIRFIVTALRRIGLSFEMRHTKKLPSPGLKAMVLLTRMI